MYFYGVTAIKQIYHPNACLTKIHNVKNGLQTRTKILIELEKQPLSAPAIVKEAKISYASVRHHLRLMEDEATVQRKGRRPCIWLLTGLGQKRLD
jgi:predicted ArsR family transcriptional regulator